MALTMRLPRYPRQSGGQLRGFGAFGQEQAGPCWTQADGSVMCPEGYAVDPVTGRVVQTKETERDWRPVVDAATGLIRALVGPQGQQYNYPAGQGPAYQSGASYAPPKKWYEEVPFWAWALGGGALAVVVMRRR